MQLVITIMKYNIIMPKMISLINKLHIHWSSLRSGIHSRLRLLEIRIIKSGSYLVYFFCCEFSGTTGCVTKLLPPMLCRSGNLFRNLIKDY